jgi:hypothetical protein
MSDLERWVCPHCLQEWSIREMDRGRADPAALVCPDVNCGTYFDPDLWIPSPTDIRDTLRRTAEALENGSMSAEQARAITQECEKALSEAEQQIKQTKEPN